MKLYSWNVNGIRAAEKKGLVDWIKSEQPDVLGIQELKATEDQLPDTLKQIDGYHAFFNPAERKGYSGTAVYYKEAPLDIHTGLSDDRFNHEGRTIVMEYPDFTLYNIYFPNGGQGDDRLQFKMDFYDCFQKDVNALVAEGKRVIVCGDVNTAHTEIDLKNPKSNAKRSGFLPIEREWVTQFLNDGYIDTYRYFHPDQIEYSWWSYRFNARANNAGWRIDYFFASDNAKDLLEDAAIHTDVMGSDHCPISLTLKI
ncbi:MAG: exodeoxyribonuclease III [Eubacteriaceae bacterium]|uniref:Exodeoxyribonuclease III n=1 Tax=Candidatus Pseudoramibacter fermentans TaxID=2594427 RepID=A0A6L5GT82_9FIRM|nr:exodeoxyribonuclease III [Candidatus Pseudoramibacter fermentans]RRF93384.1 MAG: exodeoxyribonuclease III [Eubacteriaceae bacterium]